MERRSGRGRQDTGKSSTPAASAGGGKRGSVNAAGSKSEPRPPAAAAINQNNKSPSVVPASEVPDIGAEEVVLNRRGMPARQRKRNRLYFDDDMITPENWGTAIARNAKKVKAEPVDVTTDDDDDGEEILGDLPDIHVASSPASSGKQSGGRSRPSASPSPTKAIPGKQTPKRVQESVPEKGSKNKASTPAGGRTPVSERGSPARGGNRQPSLQLLTATANSEKSPTKQLTKTTTKTNSVPTPGKTSAGKVTTPKIKPDPDAPPPVPLPTSRKKDMDRWGKLVQRANNLKKDREEREAQKQVGGQKGATKDQERTPQKDKDNQDNNYEKRSPKKDQQRQQEKERERVQKEKEKQQQAQLQKEKEERLAKERLLKEKEKKVVLKEKKRDHRDSITVLPPVVKLASRATAYLTGEEQQHNQQPIPPQQLMAVIKIDDTTTQVIDKRVAHDISIRLRNLLKLPKAHKWVCYEWFYSNIDK